mgnify:CR=1 FL=1
MDAVLIGGFPEMLLRTDPQRRRAWARDYLNTLVQRDVADIAEVDRQQRMLRLFRLLAHHSGQLTNDSRLAGKVGLDDKTARRYVTILEQLYVVRLLDPWFRNRLKRVVKTPKLHFLDSGLLAGILGSTQARIESDRSGFGALLESFVFAEISRQSGWMDDPCILTHYRDKDQDEVDIVVEDFRGWGAHRSLRGSAFRGPRIVALGLRRPGGAVKRDRHSGFYRWPLHPRPRKAPNLTFRVDSLWGRLQSGRV